MAEDTIPRLDVLLAALDDEPAGTDSCQADADHYPAAGAVAALVAALAASLVSAAADRSRGGWDGAGGARAQALALRRRAVGLARRDAEAYATARRALAGGAPPDRAQADPAADQAARDRQLGDAIAQAGQPPLQLAASSADIAQLARAVAERGAGEVRADAEVAALLAAAAARSAARLVAVNLVVGGDPQLADRARGWADAASRAAAAAAAADDEASR